MGKFIYDGSVKVDFDDRTLAHLQLVIGTKLRRGEPFHFTWKDDTSIGDGRTTVWVHPRCTLVYKYYGSRKPTINMAWIEARLQEAPEQYLWVHRRFKTRPPGEPPVYR